jgi:hypothetical protein
VAAMDDGWRRAALLTGLEASRGNVDRWLITRAWTA